MPHNRYILCILIAFALSLSAIFLVLSRLDPYESTSLALGLLFLSAFICLTSFFALLGYFIRKLIYNNEIIYSHINIALRQGLLLSVCSLACFFLLITSTLKWWSGGLIIVFITLIELYVSNQEN
jgi:hypothetical protein